MILFQYRLYSILYWRSEAHVFITPNPSTLKPPKTLKTNVKQQHCVSRRQGWERTLYPSSRDGSPFIQLGASMILHMGAPSISHSLR